MTRTAKATIPHLYHTIEAAIRDDILSGRQAVGSCLPTEHDLSQRFQASRFTVRRALAGLRERGLVEPRPGHGTFVIAGREGDGFVQSLASLEELLQYPDGTRRETLSLQPVTVTGTRAEELDCADGTSWTHLRAVRRLRSTDQPIGFIEGWIAPRFADVLQRANPQSVAVLKQIEEWHGECRSRDRRPQPAGRRCRPSWRRPRIARSGHPSPLPGRRCAGLPADRIHPPRTPLCPHSPVRPGIGRASSRRKP
jgi:GntR family transcriptional regulator